MADHLAGPVRRGRRPRIGTRGLSAGGLLQAAVYTDAARPVGAPCVAEVPFVDVVTTMLDPSIPLTVNEWDEWGDPREPRPSTASCGRTRRTTTCRTGRGRRCWSPAAVHDPRVMVHEPAKWVARLRATQRPGDRRRCSGSSSASGAHTGPAGRYAHYRYEAEVLAWMLDTLGVRAESSV